MQTQSALTAFTDCTTEETTSQAQMEGNDWSFVLNFANGLGTSRACLGDAAFHGWASSNGKGYAKKTLTGEGHIKLTYGNCWKSGEVWVWKNDVHISTAQLETNSEVAEFDFEDGDVVKLTDEVGNSVMLLQKIEICRAGGAGGPPAGGHGDPHIINIKGERFNINRQGYAPMVSIASEGAAHLEVMALIQGLPGLKKCSKKMLITAVNSSGSWLEKNVAVTVRDDNQAFRVMVDGQEVWSPGSQGYVPPTTENIVFNHAEKFSIKEMSAQATRANQPGIELQTAHDVKLKIVRPLHRAGAPPHLNFDIVGLKKLPQSFKLGGLLGGEDHSHWSTRDQDCGTSFAREMTAEGSVASAQ